jgi:hypothetical protein
MLASAMPYKEEENKVKVGTNDPILMHFLSLFGWQIVFSLLTEVVKSSKWLKISAPAVRLAGRQRWRTP